MSSLMDSLPPELVRSLLSEQIQPGAVFFLYDQAVQKNKYILILGIDTNKIWVSSLYISTEINKNVIRTLEQRDLQFKIKASDYDFLYHDSWINASSFLRREINNLVDIFISKKCAYQGQINSRDFDYLRSIMAESKLFSKAEKKELCN